MKAGIFLGIMILVIISKSNGQSNDNISLQGKSVMYRMGGKVFYGRPLKNLSVEKQDISQSDSAAIMKVNKKDAFGDLAEINLEPISDTDFARIEANEAGMKIRKSDVFGDMDEKNLKPIKGQRMTIVETKEDAKMKVRAADAFGNVAYENLEPIILQKVILLDENETVMRVTTTDAFGNFTFENLHPEGNYKIKLQIEENPGLGNDNLIYLANSQGDVLETFNLNEGKDFIFSRLAIDSIKIKLLDAEEVPMEK